ncbi:MAG: hypothetical protein V3T74_08110 [Gemmatimonadales bacterium]|jgi:glucose-6-phosphate isomerase
MIQDLRAAVVRRLETIRGAGVVPRIWAKDPTVWSDDPETPEITNRLGWLRVGGEMLRLVGDLEAFANEIRRDFDRVVLLGMGGSSLAPEVFLRSFGRRAGYPSFHMLDSTDPRAIAAVENGGHLDRTLFIVASKSGTTLETLSFYRYFWKQTAGCGSQFVAITDAGTPLERLAQEQGFRRIFLNPDDIGGRYSVLSLFGLVPAALMGVPLEVLLGRAEAMAAKCGADVPPARNPGAWLGTVMAEAALAGRDKLTFVLSPGIAPFGMWAEQLVAESTGKDGKGILPVVDHVMRRATAYPADRLFVVMELRGEEDPRRETWMGRLVSAGHPVVRITLEDQYDLAAEFFCWEFATAVAGAVLGVNPFDQPNVAESKRNTQRMLADRTEPAVLPQPRRHDVLSFFEGTREGDYVAVLAYLPPTTENDERLRTLRVWLGDRLEAAVTSGYGPRYLHSTGQYHKGGPPKGHFIQLYEPSATDVRVPGEVYTFGELIAAQAAGDLQALTSRGRPLIRVSDLEQLLENA